MPYALDGGDSSLLAPVLIFTFKRLDSLKVLLNSLESNSEISETDLYVFSDLNTKEEDSEKVEDVRRFLREYSTNSAGYNSIEIIEASEHLGLAGSVISGVSRLIAQYGRVIVLEDDLVVSNNYLKYMNQSLDVYEKDDRIWSVSGYSPDIAFPRDYMKPVYLSYRATSWGWATWSDRWDSVDWEMKGYDSYRRRIVDRLRFCRGGNDLPSMLRAHMKGQIDSWAVRWCYHQSMQDKMSVTPVRSLVINSGFGVDATNCNEEIKERFGKEILDRETTDWSCTDLQPDRRITDGFKKMYDLTVYVRIRDKLRGIFGR